MFYLDVPLFFPRSLKMKSLIGFLLLGFFFIAPIWLIQTVSSESLSAGPNDIFLPIVANPPILLKNGNFEAGMTVWSQYSSNYWWLIVHKDDLPIKPHGGVWAAWLGGDYNEDSILWQEVTIPFVNPTLTYWLWIDSEDDCGYDVAGVTLSVIDVVDAYWLCAANNTGGWMKRTVDLSAFSGKTFDLEFAAFNDDLLISNLFIDDVSFGQTSLDSAANEPTHFPQSSTYQVKSADLITIHGINQRTDDLQARLQIISSLTAEANKVK